MSFAARIKALILRRNPPRAGGGRAGPQVDEAAPLLTLLDEAEPQPELWAQIAAQLDQEAQARQRRLGLRQRALPFALGVALGVAATCLLAWYLG